MANNPLSRPVGAFLMSALLLSWFLLSGCEQDYQPKRRAYPRVSYPKKAYRRYQTDSCPFRFQIPAYAQMEAYRFGKPEPCWQTLHFKPFEAYLHLSYKPVRGKEAKLNQMAEDARQFVYNHTVKAQQIQQSLIHDGDSVNGVFYELGGETASAVQFYVTDSSRHYLRGALYFKAKTNRDSLDPIIDFIKADIRKLIESLEWKEAPDYKGGDLQARP